MLAAVVRSWDTSLAHCVNAGIRLAGSRGKVGEVDGQQEQRVGVPGSHSAMSLPALWRDCMKQCL